MRNPRTDPYPIGVDGEFGNPDRAAEPEPVVGRQLPKPPPAGLDPVKWAALSRADRRALLRHHRKVAGG